MAASRGLLRGSSVASANGVEAAAAITTGGLSPSLRRTSGAARPAASTVQAAARIAVERGTVSPNISTRVDGSGTATLRVDLGWTGVSSSSGPRGPRDVPGGRAPRGRGAWRPRGSGGDERRLAHEGAHDARARVDLRMPLHPEHPRGLRQLDRLHELVEARPTRCRHAVPQRVDALVMVRLGGVQQLAA